MKQNIGRALARSVVLTAMIWAATAWAQQSSPPVTSTVTITAGSAISTAGSAISLSPSSVAALANHRSAAITLSANSTVSGTANVTLNDGGIGGRFYSGAQSFAAINSVAMTASSSVTLYYCPPYNQTGTVTVTASSSVGSATTSVAITPYTKATPLTPWMGCP